MAQHDLSEDDYLHVGDRDNYDGYSEAERDALEYCEKYATDHLLDCLRAHQPGDGRVGLLPAAHEGP